MIFDHSNYRSYLGAVLAERIGRNPAYSLRLFAWELGLAHSTLSGLLNAKKNLSSERAIKLCAKLELTAAEREYFLMLVRLESARDPELRDSLHVQLARINPGRRPHDLSVDHFKSIADWYHFPIMELTELPGPGLTAEWAAEKLGLTVIEAQTAIERLMRLEILERDDKGRLRKVRRYVLVSSPESAPAVRRYYQMMLKKAQDSVEELGRDERRGGAETLAFPRSKLKEFESVLEEFFQRVFSLAEGEEKTDVFHLNVQFFNLTRSKIGERKS